jgi:hypothetical protein
MKIPKDIKIKKFQYLFTNKGKRYFYKNNIQYGTFQIIALINNMINYCYIKNYPYILEGINKEKLIFDIKLYLLIEKMGCMLYNFDSTKIYIVKNIKNLKNILLFKYIYINENEKIQYGREILNIVDNILQGIEKRDSKNGLLYSYLIYYFPDELKSKVNTQQQLNDVIEDKYKLIKKHDNFASFNKFFNESYQTAEDLIIQYQNNPEFKKFYKKESKKIYPIHFNICKSLINPLYTDEVANNIEDYVRSINLRPKYSLKL